MRLSQVQVFTYRNIVDSSPVAVDEEVTCLVGKNESGKSAFLEALEWLNPAREGVTMDPLHRYPAWRERQDRRARGGDLGSVKLVRAEFVLEDDDRETLPEQLLEVLQSERIVVTRSYDGSREFSVDIDVDEVLDRIRNAAEIDEAVQTQFADVESLDGLEDLLAELEGVEDQETQSTVRSVRQRREQILGAPSVDRVVQDYIEPLLPTFFFFPEYATLPSEVDIEQILTVETGELERSEQIAKHLLLLAAASREYLENPDYERRKRELENVANELTDEILRYWSQNPDLRVEVDIDPQIVEEPRPGNQPPHREVVRRLLKVRMRDGRHMLSLPFDEKSTGFQWFFSFLASFSRFFDRDEPVVILLDEPALGLHAKAQKDFLNYINTELTPVGQVFYTTHSPFMVEPEALERVRLVEDRGPPDGAEVVDDVLAIDPDTLFPLQGALGYDMAQHLFIGPNNLVVEGTSDFTYLTVMSTFLDSQGRTSLDEEWTVVPVGGADMIPTFVALLGRHLDVTVLVDGQRADHQKLNRLANDDYLTRQRIIPVAEVVGGAHADIEDVFDPADYVDLFKRTFGEELDVGDLQGTDPIVSQITRERADGDFNHGRPADELLNHRDEILPELSDTTLERFETLFERINATRQRDHQDASG